MNKSIVLISAALAAFASSASAADGKATYAQACAACHAAGVAGAPKTGDNAAWAARVASGRDALLVAVVKGKGAMPPKGGNAALSDDDVKAAMNFMLDQVK